MTTATQNRKLGRGLSALIGDSKIYQPKDQNSEAYPQNRKANNQEVQMISVNKITAGIYQPRRHFDNESIKELALSIKSNDLIQPIILRKSEDDGHYEIIAGERRFRAIKLLKLDKIPAIVKKINNHEALEMALVENVQRADLSLIEEAKGYKQLINEFSYTQDQVAKKTGKSRPHVANLLRLLELPISVKNMISDKKISMGHARAIIKSSNPELLAEKIIDDSLSVRDAEDLIRNEKIENLRSSPVLERKELNIKFINSGELTDIENKLSQVLNSKVKISYNQFKNSGKIIINFSDFDLVHNLVEKIEN